MARTVAVILEHLAALLRDPVNGAQQQVVSIASRDQAPLDPLHASSIVLINAPSEVIDQARDFVYPHLLVFAEQVENRHNEKFGPFSGPVRVGIEIRASSLRIDCLETNLHRYVEAVTNTLDACREWPDGVSYSGRYTATFTAARLGGSNYIQSARVVFLFDQFVAESIS